MLRYMLAIPKGDTHEWQDKRVDFFNMSFRTIGYPIQGIEENIPLDWNKKIKAELLKTNGECTIYEKGTYTRHLFSDVYICDERETALTKMREAVTGELTVRIYSLNTTDNGYVPQNGDIIVLGNASFEFDSSSEKNISEDMAKFRNEYPDYAVIFNIRKKLFGDKPDYIIKAR